MAVNINLNFTGGPSDDDNNDIEKQIEEVIDTPTEDTPPETPQEKEEEEPEPDPIYDYSSPIEVIAPPADYSIEANPPKAKYTVQAEIKNKDYKLPSTRQEDIKRARQHLKQLASDTDRDPNIVRKLNIDELEKTIKNALQHYKDKLDKDQVELFKRLLDKPDRAYDPGGSQFVINSYDEPEFTYSDIENFTRDVVDDTQEILEEDDTPEPPSFQESMPEPPPPSSTDDPDKPPLGEKFDKEAQRKREREARQARDEERRTVRRMYQEAARDLNRDYQDRRRAMRDQIAEIRKEAAKRRSAMHAAGRIFGGHKGSFIASIFDKLVYDRDVEHRVEKQKELIYELEQQHREALDNSKDKLFKDLEEIEKKFQNSTKPQPQNIAGPSEPQQPEYEDAEYEFKDAPPPPASMDDENAPPLGGVGGGKPPIVPPPPGSPPPPPPEGGGMIPFEHKRGKGVFYSLPSKYVEPVSEPPVATGPSIAAMGTAAVVGYAAYKGFKQVAEDTQYQVDKELEYWNKAQDKDFIGMAKSKSDQITNAGILGMKPFKFMEPASDAALGTLELIEQHTHALVEQGMAVMPETTQASVETEIAQMMNTFRNAQKSDNIVSEITRAEAKLSMTIDNFMTKLLQLLGPSLEAMIKLLTIAVRAAEFMLDILMVFTQIAESILSTIPGMSLLLKAIHSILDKHDNADDMQPGIFDKIRAFETPAPGWIDKRNKDRRMGKPEPGKK